MSNVETLLVLTSFVFGAVLYGVLIIKGPRLHMIDNSHVFFDKTRLPRYFIFLLVVTAVSFVAALTISRDTSISLQYAGVNGFLAGVTGSNFILYRYRDQKKEN